MFWTFLQVALGGALGSVARYGVMLGSGRMFGGWFPFGTLAVNILGGLVMGVFAVVAAGHLRPFLMAGVLGGFTTFSAFSLDAVTLWERGDAVLGGVYVGTSVILSIAAVVLGGALARMWWL